MKNYYVSHYKIPVKNKFGYATIVMKKPLLDVNTFEVGISFCSPEDQFSKKKGRDKAIEILNLEKHKFRIKFINMFDKTKNLKIDHVLFDVFRVIIRKSKDLPHWTKENWKWSKEKYWQYAKSIKLPKLNYNFPPFQAKPWGI